jgi:hypothetical protein
VFAIAAFSFVIIAAVAYGAIGNWRRGDKKIAVALIALEVLPSLIAAGAIYRLVTNDDPLDWIRYPVPCWLGAC